MKAAILALVGLTVWAYSSVWGASFVYEDQAWRHATVATVWARRALTTWSWTVVQGAVASHGLNLALHLLTACVFWRLAQRIGLTTRLAALVAALWVLHPLNVETVAYAASRAELLSTLAVVGACWLAARGDGWWGVVLCGAAAVWVKESAVVGLALVPLTLWVCGHPARFVSLVSVGVASLGLVAVGGWTNLVNAGEAPGAMASAGPWLLVQATATVRLLFLSVIPYGMTVDYDYDLVPISVRLVCVLLLVALGLVTWQARQERRLAWGLAWILVSVVPRLVIQTPRSYLNEHQWSVPLLGVLLTVGAAIEWCRVPVAEPTLIGMGDPLYGWPPQTDRDGRQYDMEGQFLQ